MAELNKDVFGLTVENHELLKTAYDAYLANSRSSHAKTLKRGEVRGGGKKPWKTWGPRCFWPWPTEGWCWPAPCRCRGTWWP